ncbi:S-adenosylmethionine-dependent methyltransferase [Marinospirillum celere]|uniref:tRNA 5-carboxymethoxyuridine methyltransferase n=1 Tax=Marinospirillum celere TaxID=1122252 RepID=A0A1I1IRV0_9GAMM|nr:methyltransferase domain-containing protein [Marinospirillum celere]SFC38989.1 S-adenosylmethionine-dependent methyltransferase [Marinospirillum celere]
MSGYQQDKSFQGLAAKFARNIYGTPKGRLRLKILRDRMLAELPLDGPPLQVLDAGGGLGQISAWLARKGHDVLLAEPAEEMLAYANKRLKRAGVETLAASIQDLSECLPDHQQTFDLVVCHAVLEWLYQPQETLELLLSRVKPGGYLSLMFFNADALMFTNILRGNWQRALQGEMQGKGKGTRLTPISPLQPDQVLCWLEKAGFEIISKTGVRVFNDYLRLQLPPEAQPERLLQLEKKYCQKEPYWRLGRYLLVHAKKPS